MRAGKLALIFPTLSGAACIVEHVKAEIANASHRSLVLHTYSYFNAHQNSDGSLVHSGPKRGEGYRYIASDGTRYQRNWTYNKDGSPTGIIGHCVTGLVVNGKQESTLTLIDTANHTYSQQRTEYFTTGEADPPDAPILGLQSSPVEVRQALASGRVTRSGTTKVNGTAVIAISVALPRTRPRSIHFTVYVNARTYQPLRTVTVVDDSLENPYIAEWMPATPDAIAQAKDDSIPAGYTKVDDVHAVA